MSRAFFAILLALTLVAGPSRTAAAGPSRIAAQATTCAADETTYVVKPGDWVWKIARELGVDPKRIVARNFPANSPNPNFVIPGQVLCIPKTAATAVPTAAATLAVTATPKPATATPAPTAAATATAKPAATATPAPAAACPPFGPFPTFRIVAVEQDKSVTIETANLPACLKFEVRMGAFGTAGLGGVVVATTDSGKGGVQRITYTIPAALKGAKQIAIRIDNQASGYYAFNWFWNATATTP